MATPVYTRGEQLRRARLLAKGMHGAYADTSRVEKQLDRIEASARERGEREAQAHQRALSGAKDDLARARVAERSATRQERQAARKARQDAERRLRLVERAAR